MSVEYNYNFLFTYTCLVLYCLSHLEEINLINILGTNHRHASYITDYTRHFGHLIGNNNQPNNVDILTKVIASIKF